MRKHYFIADPGHWQFLESLVERASRHSRSRAPRSTCALDHCCYRDVGFSVLDVILTAGCPLLRLPLPREVISQFGARQPLPFAPPFRAGL
jgi:hypothetical protein